MARTVSNTEFTFIKEIENRIYVDLWNPSLPENFEVVRKITIGFLQSSGNIFESYEFLNKQPDFHHPLGEMYVRLDVAMKNTAKRIYVTDAMI